MGVNWWNVCGLVIDVFGVVGAGLTSSEIGWRTYGGPGRSMRYWLIGLLSWAAVVIGFLLQVVGQFRR